MPALPLGRLSILLVALLCFANSLDGEFVFDDHEAVVNNGDAHWDDSNLNAFLNLFRHDFWGRDVRSPKSHKSYRPLTVLTFK